MRRSAQMYIDGNIELLNEIHKKVKDDAIKSKVVATSSKDFSDMLSIIIYQDTEGYKTLMEYINKYNLFHTFAEGREYTKEEIKSAKYFTVEIIYPWEKDGTSADEYGTKYEDTCSCKLCKGSKKQISDLIINKKKMGKYDIATIQPEIIVNEKLYNLILENELSGCEFKLVRDYKGREEPVFYQLVVNNILPNMNDGIRTEIVEDVYCKKCKRNGVFLRSEVIYNKESMKEACDFNLTSEYFGQNLYCAQTVIASKKVFDLFKKNKIKRVFFEPVNVI